LTPYQPHQQHQQHQPHVPSLFNHSIAGGGVAGSYRPQSYGLTHSQQKQPAPLFHHSIAGGHAGSGHGGAGWLLIEQRYTNGPAVFLVTNHRGQFKNLYGNYDPGESHFRTAMREMKEETKGVFENTTPTSRAIPYVQFSKYSDQRLYYCNVEPAPGQKSGLKTRQMFEHNDQVLRRTGAGREFFKTTGLVRVLIADLQRVFAANPGNKGLVLVGTHGESGVLKGRDATYLRQILASNLHLTAPTLHSTFVRHANCMQTYYLQ